MDDLLSNEAFAKHLIDENETFVIKTDLQFLREHKGLRPGKMHLFLSSTGAGKSTLMRTIMTDYLLNNNGKILLWLSEETENDFMTMASYSVKNFGLLRTNIKIFSEVDASTEKLINSKKGKRHEILMELFCKLKDRNYGLVIFDNISTSSLYTQDINLQSEIAHKLKTTIKDMACPLIVVSHTAKNEHLKKYLFDDDSIRGSNTPSMIAEYSYFLNNIENNEKRVSILKIGKTRTHSPKNRLFSLEYDHDLKIYSALTAIKQEDLDELRAKK